MLKIPYEEIILKIEAKTGLPQTQIESKINDKLKALYGLVSKEGAAHIIANELGVKLFEQTSGKLAVKSLLSGMREVELHGSVRRIYEVRTFQKDNREGQVGSFLFGDDTGVVRIVLWNEQAAQITNLKEGTILIIKGGTVKERNGFKEIHLSERSSLEVTGEEAPKASFVPIDYARKPIKELTEQDGTAEILGTIVQVFDLKFFEVCPSCAKRAKPTETGFFCAVHGTVTPNHAAVLNLFLDDGTDSIRVVCFQRQLAHLLGEQDIGKYRSDTLAFEQKKNDMLGSILKISGRIVKNTLYDRLEMIASLVYLNPDPAPEIARLAEAKKQSLIPDHGLDGAEEPTASTQEEIIKDEDLVDE